MSILGIFREHIKTLSEKRNNQINSYSNTGMEIKIRAKRNSKNLPDDCDDIYVSRQGARSWKDKTKRKYQYKSK